MLLTACSVTPFPGKLRQSPGTVEKIKKCLSKSRDHRRDRSPANICSGRATSVCRDVFQGRAPSWVFCTGRVRQRNAAEGFLQIAVGALQPPAPSLMGTRS